MLALPVGAGTGSGAESAAVLLPVPGIPSTLTEECTALLEQAAHTGRAGRVQSLPRPLARPRRVLLTGIGDGDEAGWRSAGAAVARAATREPAVTIALPAGVDPAVVRGVAEGALLGSYRFRLGADPPDQAPRLRRVTLAVPEPERYESTLAIAAAVAEATCFARDLTNTPSIRKHPDWFARQVAKAAGALPGVRVRVWTEPELREAGFGGILAVGGGSAHPPRLLELDWRPRGASRHVALVGKGITFDTGGISIKPASAMKLMRKDMAGGAAVAAAVLGAAKLRLPVRVSALVPLAENMLSGTAQRPGDVIRHWGGRTSEVRNTDAEGRLVLADALAYAAARLRPDLLLDLATLTGANAVALGKRTAALYTEDTRLADALLTAAAAAGEQVWRMPLVDDYADGLSSEVADLTNSPEGGAGSVMAALYLREFTGAARPRWAHLDMSAPSWADRDDGELSRGATGWGVRTLLRFLSNVPEWT
ncbi:MAG TPA: leucyl aminopeptidase [Natronosporangium sp.]